MNSLARACLPFFLLLAGCLGPLAQPPEPLSETASSPAAPPGPAEPEAPTAVEAGTIRRPFELQGKTLLGSRGVMHVCGLVGPGVDQASHDLVLESEINGSAVAATRIKFAVRLGERQWQVQAELFAPNGTFVGQALALDYVALADERPFEEAGKFVSGKYRMVVSSCASLDGAYSVRGEVQYARRSSD